MGIYGDAVMECMLCIMYICSIKDQQTIIVRRNLNIVRYAKTALCRIQFFNLVLGSLPWNMVLFLGPAVPRSHTFRHPGRGKYCKTAVSNIIQIISVNLNKQFLIN